MNAREELAVILETEQEHGNWPETPDLDLYGCMADAILAAGYRKPRTITTAEELDALADGSIVLDADPDALLKLASGRWRSLIDPSDTFQGGMLSLPATVLHEPAAAA